ncbi:DUF1648 domain-containing protein [Demequina sp.]|uniref:DUF1648 domain-containing protein n=1 Tax=Demequina sp. TaxID=2050685 RepID=UPI003A8891C9
MLDNSTAIRRASVAGLWVPAIATATALAVQLAILGDLPDTVATHWGPHGPDGFSPALLVPVMTALTTGLISMVLGGAALRTVRRGRGGSTPALLIGTAAGLSVFLGTLLTGSLLMQRGLEDAADAADLDPWIYAALGAGLLVGFVAWLVQPKVPTMAEPAASEALDLHDGERAMWARTATLEGWPRTMLAASTLTLALGAVVVAVLSEPAIAWILAGVAALIGLLLVALGSFVVRADATGLTVSSRVGIARLRVPAEDIASVRVIEADGLGQFGGYGVRLVPRATAVVLRDGEAIEITRASGRKFVVTVDDASTGAALLAAVAGGQRATQD